MEKIICHFDKAQYLAGENIYIMFPFRLPDPQITLFQLEKEIPVQIEICENQIILSQVHVGNYGVHIWGNEYDWEGAFDVVNSPRHVTRYGFLSDFSKDDDKTDVEWMRDLHLNAVQFYDWMYRHDKFLPPTEVYSDPMGRPACLSTVRIKISACREMGIRSFAYGAVYAATPEIYEAHPQWAMYTMENKPMQFAGWLYYMNVSSDCVWTDYLLEQYRAAFRLGFSGIHMDTYGFPKRVWDYNGKPIDLAQAFPELITRASQVARDEGETKGVIFNAVNNWPIETVASAPQDAVYIEVWPPNNSYLDLYILIREGKLLSDKPVVLAAYLKPFLGDDRDAAMRALRLCWAAICASGGTQLIFGENQAVLQDSYYANYAQLRTEDLPVAQKYCDFLVRYADLLYDNNGTDISRTASGGINEDVCFSGRECKFSVDAQANTVWTLIKGSCNRLTVQMINLRGNNEQWNEPKSLPLTAVSIQMFLRLDRPLRGIYYASPDGATLSAISLPYRWENTDEGRVYTVDLPPLEYWYVVWIEMEYD